jgi:hypothetical protein
VDNLYTVEIDQLDPEKLGVSQESLEAAKQLPEGIKQRIITAEPSDFCDGKACTIATEVADSMANPESMTDLAVELVGGALIKAGVDTYKVVKAGSKVAEEFADAGKVVVSEIKTTDNVVENVATKTDGEMIGQPEVKLELPKFETKGLAIKRPQDIPVGQEMIAEYIKMGASRDDAIRYAKEAIVSGTDIPVIKIIDEPLYKVVPKNSTVSDHTVFWMSRSELDRLIENPTQFAKNTGLPLPSNSVAYDVYKITPKAPAKVFENKIADTAQGAFTQEANATQVLVPNRKQFTDPIKAFDFGGNN